MNEYALLTRLALAAGLTACVPPANGPDGSARPSTPTDSATSGVDTAEPQPLAVPSARLLNAALTDHVLHVWVVNEGGQYLELRIRAEDGSATVATATVPEGFTEGRVPVTIGTDATIDPDASGALDGPLVAELVWAEADGTLSSIATEPFPVDRTVPPTASYRKELHPGAVLDLYGTQEQVRACVLKDDWATQSCPPAEDLERWDRIELISYAIDRPLEPGGAIVACAQHLVTEDPESCCYLLSIDIDDANTSFACDTDGVVSSTYTYTDGRSFDARVAPAASSAGWSPEAPTAAEAPLAAAHWTRVAQAEHASVASFARFTLELLALGAPAALVEQSVQAQHDEVQHARLAFGLASRAAGAPVGPGPLSIAGALERSDDRAAVLTACIHEGCMGETLAAAVVAATAEACTDAELSASLRAVADDEARHAELAWAFVRWLLDEHPELQTVAARAFATAPAHPDTLQAAIPRWGVLGSVQERAIAERVHHEVIAPLAHALLAQAA